MADNAKKLFELPTSDQGCHGAYVTTTSGVLHAVFTRFEGDQIVFGLLNFQGVLAYKYASEPVSFELAAAPSAYDAVVEIRDSEWAKLHMNSYKLPGPKNWKHLCVYFSNDGLLNVLCKEVELIASIERNEIVAIIEREMEGE